MVSRCGHFVPNPVSSTMTDFRPKCKTPPFFLHTRYDARGDLTGLTHYQGSTVLAGYTWAYNAAGQVTDQSSFADTADTSSRSASDPTTWASVHYNYDSDGQLASSGSTHAVTYSNFANAPGGGSEDFSYDANGNSASATVGNDNQIQSDGTYGYYYDAAGNLTCR